MFCEWIANEARKENILIMARVDLVTKGCSVYDNAIVTRVGLV